MPLTKAGFAVLPLYAFLLLLPQQDATAGSTFAILAVGAKEFASFAPSSPSAVVRIRLVDSVSQTSAGASIRVPGGTAGVYIVEVKRTAVTADVLAAAFSVLSNIANKQSKTPQANIMLYLPDNVSQPKLAPSERKRFERLITDLKAAKKGEFLEVSG